MVEDHLNVFRLDRRAEPQQVAAVLYEAAADDTRLARSEQWRRCGRLLQRAVAEAGEDVKHRLDTAADCA